MLRERRWEEVADALAAARRRKPELAELLTFLEQVLAAQHEWRVQVGLDALPDDLLKDRAGRREPLLSRGEFPVDLDSAGRLFRALSRLAKTRGGHVEAAALEIERALEDGRLALPALLKGALAEEGHAYAVAHEHGLDPELLDALAEWSLHPSLEACAQALGQRVQEVGWGEARCPICGSAPAFAELRGEDVTSLRFLHCGFCGWSWQFRRVGCPFCGCMDHTRLRTLVPEDDQRCVLDVCDQCHRYIKTVDNRSHFGLIPEVEALIASPLDLIARGRGYT